MSPSALLKLEGTPGGFTFLAWAMTRNVASYAGWHCIHIEHVRLIKALDVTFRQMLISEYVDLGQPDNCRVYRWKHEDGGYSYYFSPGAVQAMGAFVHFWHAFGVFEPGNLAHMEVII